MLEPVSLDPARGYDVISQPLGIACPPEVVAWETFFDRMETTRPHALLWGWSVDHLDPDNVLRVGMAQVLPYTRWEQGRYARLVERARCTGDPRKRVELYRQGEELLTDEVVLLSLAYLRSHRLVKRWVGRLPISAVRGALWKDAYIEPTSVTAEALGSVKAGLASRTGVLARPSRLFASFLRVATSGERKEMRERGALPETPSRSTIGPMLLAGMADASMPLADGCCCSE